MDKEKTDLLKKNRVNTDDSLQSERSKTDTALMKENKIAESKSNEIVRKNRQEADKTLQKNRNRLDRQRMEYNEKSRTPLVDEERMLSDTANKVARKNEDQVLKKERSQKIQIAQNVLDKERSETDYNLNFERIGTDAITESISILVTSANEALNTRDTYLGILSHDLKNPLTAISLSASAIKKDLVKKELFDFYDKYFESIERNISTMGRMIDDLLDVEQMVQGALKLRLKKYDLAEIILECKELFAPIAESKKVTVQIEPMEKGMLALVDHDRISQVLSNLVGNALKFSKPGDVITLSAKKDENQFYVSVKDNGPGIPEDKLGEIFERFAQLKSHDRAGAGLGLFISKWIVKAHEGEIYATSTLGKGSTFYFTLPMVHHFH